MRRYLFDHLAPEDRPIARRIYLAMLAVYLSALLLLGAAVRLSAPSTGSVTLTSEPWSSPGLFGAVAAERPDLRECAVRDLRILTALGERGEAQDVAGEDIAAAFFTLLKARQACAAGNVTEALAIYESIAVGRGRSAKR
jgi:hypothetical protein